MLLLRSLALAVAIAIIVLVGLAVITGNPRYKRWAMRLGISFVAVAVMLGLGVLLSSWLAAA
ncbi:hypothetical protein [Piscinibacterium candidicorallinum]|jgi:lipopolysaccharide export LptBFGC system permease protein LptF|uniref:Uncharacterized protein n=1 Tax=Piscinibacterium candidicorallinum TaxID=1793872 RepID=A0ABV7HB48_9BURK